MDTTDHPSRRELLMAALSVALTPSDARARAAAGRRIAIVGAGLAGLSAARELRRRGADVFILEARDRIGGRIWTSRLWPDIPVDLGASWIHGIKGNPLSALANEAGAKRQATRYAAAIAYGASGEVTDLDSATTKAQAIIGAARKAARKADQDMPLARAIEEAPGWKQADAVSRRLIRHAVNATVEQEYGGSWSEVSARHFDEIEEFSGGDELFPLGFDQITSMLARGLDIRLGQPVRSVDRTARGVRLTLAGGSALDADHAVITVPLGVLRSGGISFASPLAPARLRAIEALRMGLLNKCWLRFDRVRWPEDVDWIEWLGPEDGVWAEWVSLARVAKTPVLLGFHAGDQARRMEALDDPAMMTSAHEALKAIFGSSFAAPVAAQVTRWSQDPFALGAYTFNAVGVTPGTRRALAGTDWDGRLVFAGEAASPGFFGTAHGAVLSGRDAARELTER